MNMQPLAGCTWWNGVIFPYITKSSNKDAHVSYHKTIDLFNKILLYMCY